MNFSEAIKALEENPNKVFEFNDVWKTAKLFIDDGWFQLEFYNNVGKLIPEDCDGGAFSGNIHIDSNWQEVKQPVPWQEALEAWAFKGKTIRCTLNDLDYIYKHEFTYGGDVFLESDGDPLELDEIKFGTWYIED